MSTTTWREQFAHERKIHDDQSPVVAVAPDESVLDVQFNQGYGGAEGPEVLIWTEERGLLPGPVRRGGMAWLRAA